MARFKDIVSKDVKAEDDRMETREGREAPLNIHGHFMSAAAV